MLTIRRRAPSPSTVLAFESDRRATVRLSSPAADLERSCLASGFINRCLLWSLFWFRAAIANLLSSELRFVVGWCGLLFALQFTSSCDTIRVDWKSFKCGSDCESKSSSGNPDIERSLRTVNCEIL